ncbi:hypothetical protein HispidOSU_014994 [Sigmodon hispidus]
MSTKGETPADPAGGIRRFLLVSWGYKVTGAGCGRVSIHDRKHLDRRCGYLALDAATSEAAVARDPLAVPSAQRSMLSTHSRLLSLFVFISTRLAAAYVS